jgi:hypothetical protein
MLQDIIQHSAKGELHVAQLETAARQMSAYAQSNRLKQLASLIVARTSPAEVQHATRSEHLAECKRVCKTWMPVCSHATHLDGHRNLSQWKLPKLVAL